MKKNYGLAGADSDDDLEMLLLYPSAGLFSKNDEDPNIKLKTIDGKVVEMKILGEIGDGKAVGMKILKEKGAKLTQLYAGSLSCRESMK